MITIKSPREIELLRIAGEITGSTHNYLKPFIKPGVTTKELDMTVFQEQYVHQLTKKLYMEFLVTEN